MLVFIREKIVNAQRFIEAMRQRQQTLLNTMKTIVHLQPAFFREESEDNLKPMVMREVAAAIGMDTSTVSRIVSSKAVQTAGGIYPLKFFFTSAVATTDGVASNRAAKSALAGLIGQEDRQRPYTDEQLAALLGAKGYTTARRTVVKYRTQLCVPVARLRKEL